MDTLGFDISTDPRGQTSPSCASNGNNFLVSFNSSRCDTTVGDIYAARINANGEVFDTNGFSVCMATGNQSKSKVSYGNGNFLVLWEDERNFDSAGYDIYGSRVTPDGEVLDPQGILISASYQYELCPAIAYNGSTYLVAWELNQG